MFLRTCQALALMAVSCGFSSCGEMGAFLRLYGYSEILPPSTLLAPGAMVSIESRHPLRVRLVCGPRASLGPNWQPRKSFTASRTLAKQSGRSFQMSGEFLHAVKGEAKYSAIKKISASVERPQIAEIDDNDVISGLQYRSPECDAAIHLRLRRGYDVSMVSSALQADVIYRVSWDSSANISAQDKIGLLKGLALEIGAGTSSVSSDEIHAKGLVWGVRDDAYLAALTISEINENCVKRGTQMLRPQDMAVFDVHPVAPPVMPPPDECGRVGGQAPTFPGSVPVEGAIPSIEIRQGVAL